MCEGALQKYKPQLRADPFQDRYCQMTKHALLVFKDERAAKCWRQRPFLTIPLDIIKSVIRVEVRDQGYQFEIFLKPDYSADKTEPETGEKVKRY